MFDDPFALNSLFGISEQDSSEDSVVDPALEQMYQEFIWKRRAILTVKRISLLMLLKRIRIGEKTRVIKRTKVRKRLKVHERISAVTISCRPRAAKSRAMSTARRTLTNSTRRAATR